VYTAWKAENKPKATILCIPASPVFHKDYYAHMLRFDHL